MRWRAGSGDGYVATGGRSWALAQPVLGAIFLVIAAASITFAYGRLSRIEADRQVEKDVIRIRDELYVLRPPEGDSFLLQAYNLRGPAPLPHPFSSIQVPEGAEMRAFVYLKRRRGRLILVSLARDGGAHYLWSDFYGNRRLQRVMF